MTTQTLEPGQTLTLRTLPFVGSPGELIEAVRAARGPKRHQGCLELSAVYGLPNHLAAGLVDGSIEFRVDPVTGDVQFTAPLD